MQVTDVIKVLQQNSENARRLVADVIPRIGADHGACTFGCDRSLEHAILTAPEARDPALVARLDAVAGRVLR